MTWRNGEHCATCGRPRGLEQLRSSWGCNGSIPPRVGVGIPRTEDPNDSPTQIHNDLICRASVYRNGGADDRTHLCDECLRIGVRALHVKLSTLLGELDEGHDLRAELVSQTQRLASTQYQLHMTRYEHDRMQQRLADLLAAPRSAEAVSMAKYEVGRGPLGDRDLPCRVRAALVEIAEACEQAMAEGQPVYTANIAARARKALETPEVTS